MKRFKYITITAIIALIVFNIGNKEEYVSQETQTNSPVSTIENKINVLVDVIQEFEGYYAGSVAHRNNNPCNLRYSPLQTSKLDGFSYFETYELGREACVLQVTMASDGRSGVYTPDMTLLQFFNVYAPHSDNNQPSVYYEFVIKHTGFPRDITLAELLE